jgi:hypothetical protein
MVKEIGSGDQMLRIWQRPGAHFMGVEAKARKSGAEAEAGAMRAARGTDFDRVLQ